jgi:hypothetical protein
MEKVRMYDLIAITNTIYMWILEYTTKMDGGEE